MIIWNAVVLYRLIHVFRAGQNESHCTAVLKTALNLRIVRLN